jgi:hypothetical protein
MPVSGAVAGAVAGAAGGAASAVSGAASAVAGHVASSVIGVGVSAVFSAAGQWVASGAVWLLGQVAQAMSATTTADLSSGWFSAHEAVMATLAAAVVLPMVCCAALQALYRQSASMLVRSFLVQLPLALLLTGVVVELVQMALSATDVMSAQVLASAGVDTTHILTPVSDFLIGSAVVAPPVPAFVVFVGGLLVALAALGLWLELVVRAAAVSVATLFLPLALAAMVWPAVAHWCRRLADTLVALVLSKLVIAAVLALAVGALAGGLGVGATGGDGGGFGAVVTGIALLVIATLSPFTLLRLIPAVEAGAISHLESARHRLASAAQAPRRVRNEALDIARRAGPGALAATGGAAAPALAASGAASAATPSADTGGPGRADDGARPAGGVGRDSPPSSVVLGNGQLTQEVADHWPNVAGARSESTVARGAVSGSGGRDASHDAGEATRGGTGEATRTGTGGGSARPPAVARGAGRPPRSSTDRLDTDDR